MTWSIRPGFGTKQLHLGMSESDVVELLGPPDSEHDLPGDPPLRKLSWVDQGIAIFLEGAATTRIYFATASEATCGPLKMGVKHEDLHESFTRVTTERQEEDVTCLDVAGLTAFLTPDEDYPTGSPRLSGFMVMPRTPQGEEPIAYMPDPPSVEAVLKPAAADMPAPVAAMALPPMDNGGDELSMSEEDGALSPMMRAPSDVGPDLQGYSSEPMPMLDEVDDMAGMGDFADEPAVPSYDENAFADEEPTTAGQVADSYVDPFDMPADDADLGAAQGPILQAVPLDHLFDIEPGKGSPELHLGMTRAELVQVLGVPSGDTESAVRFAARGIEVILVDDKARAISWCGPRSPLFLGTVNPSNIDVNGLRLGDPAQRIRECLPAAKRSEDEDDDQLPYYSEHGLDVYFSHNTVIQVTVYPETGKPAAL